MLLVFSRLAVSLGALVGARFGGFPPFFWPTWRGHVQLGEMDKRGNFVYKTGRTVTQATDAVGGSGGFGRRRFVRGVGIVIPAVMTVGSRSALASVGGCLSPSASASINLTHSRPDRQPGNCALGRTPGFWQNAWYTHPADWAAVGGEGMLFSTVFLGGFAGLTLRQVMDLNGTGDPYQLGAHLCAAWCNWKMGWVPDTVLSLPVMQTMWAQGNSYQPIPGVTWSKADIVTYLKTTMPA
jgi:hypothetical protein